MEQTMKQERKNEMAEHGASATLNEKQTDAPKKEYRAPTIALAGSVKNLTRQISSA